MSTTGSITFWIQRLAPRDREAVERLWELYFDRLVRFARTKLYGPSRRESDEEDVALSAFHSFVRAAERGCRKLDDRDDMWQLLVVIASRKAANQAKRESAIKRGGGVGHVALDPPGGEDSSAGEVFHELISRESDPAKDAEVMEECQRLLDTLGDEELRRVALARLEGCTNKEIAASLNRSVGAVERKLRLIRLIWEQEATKT